MSHNTRVTKRTRRALIAVIAAFAAVSLSSCALFGNAVQEIEEALRGRHMTITTFATDGSVIDNVKGTSIRIARDTTFDTSNGDGTTNADSSVLLITVGNNSMHHVGSTMIAAEDGLTTIASPGSIDISNHDRTVPFLNDLYEKTRNITKGKSKIILIRSQFDVPLAVYAGNSVEAFATDVEKTTRFRVDGKVLVVYRANYTTYDTALLQ